MAGIGTDQAAGRRPPWWAALAAVALVVAMPVATWWLVGDLTDPDFKRRLQADGDPAIRAGLDPDYMFRPFDIAPATERTAGIVAVVLVETAAVVLILASLTGRLHGGLVGGVWAAQPGRGGVRLGVAGHDRRRQRRQHRRRDHALSRRPDRSGSGRDGAVGGVAAHHAAAAPTTGGSSTTTEGRSPIQ